MGYSALAPDVWNERFAEDPESTLTTEQCIIKGRHFFIKGLVEIPVFDSENTFSWGVWVAVSRESFFRIHEIWETPGREAEQPFFGRLSTDIPLYSPSTTNLKANAHLRPVGVRPYIELEPTDHPLAVEQRTGITRDRVRRIAEAILHPGIPEVPGV